MNKFLSVVLITLLSGYLSSCSLFKHTNGKRDKGKDTTVVHTDTGRIAVMPSPPVIPHTDTVIRKADTSLAINKPAEMAATLWKNRLDYKTFSGKARIHIETPDEDNNFAAHFRIRKDSVIWVNVNLAGIQVARVFVTTDSIFLIDYYHKEAKCYPLSQIAKILPAQVNFSSLQNLVLGEPLGDGLITESENSGDSLFLQVEDSSYLQHITYYKADSTLRNLQITTRKPAGPRATSEYSMYEMDNNRKISTNRVLHLKIGEAVYLLEMYFSKIDFDTPLDYPFSIPRNYR